MQYQAERRQKILDIVAANDGCAVALIAAELRRVIGTVSRMTVIRDLRALESQKTLRREGKGRRTRYHVPVSQQIFVPVDVEAYFAVEPDRRVLRYPRFRLAVLDAMDGFFDAMELKEMERANAAYQHRMSTLDAYAKKREWERFTIELSWKSSKIEGNTYSLLDTEALIRESQEAPRHPHSEATMILNHKRALEYIREHAAFFKHVSVREIENLHRILVQDLSVPHGMRASAVGIVGTRFRPLDIGQQIREALEATTEKASRMPDPWSRALMLLAMVSYIQPFADGNKRTSRMLANAVLMAEDVCPLSYRSIDEVEYKKAVILFYETNNLWYLKKLFVEQFLFATREYFVV